MEIINQNTKSQIPLGEDPNNPVRIYADGVYDCFHFGHARQLEQCKKIFKHVTLIVGVCGQEDTERLKGKTIMNEFERAESVKHCKWADEVICPCPWIINEEFLKQHKIDFVAHDEAPYQAPGMDDCYAFVKKLGKFKATQRTEGISTSDIINRILKDRDEYLKRNLSRGYTKKELSLNYVDIFLIWTKDFMKKLENVVPCQRRKKNFKKE